MLSCGEASGDLYAGALTRELHALDPTVRLSGLGGPEFAAAGGELIADYRGLAVTGLTEAVGKLPQWFAMLRRLVTEARDSHPEALVAIDSPDFNFPLARRLRKPFAASPTWCSSSSRSKSRSTVTPAYR
jgi:lipid-A-disaccharide synthase